MVHEYTVGGTTTLFTAGRWTPSFVAGIDGYRLANVPNDLAPVSSATDTALHAAGTTQYAAGYLPYAIVDGWQQLKTDFAYWRIDAAGEKFAKTAADHGWLRWVDKRFPQSL